MQLDKWQQELMATEGNIVLRSGRQVGKSTIVAQKAGEFAVNNSNKTVLVIACVERQALLLFEKTLSYIYNNYKDQIKKGKDKPTKHKIMLKNGTTIYCLPTGLSGYGIRGYTIDLLIADESAFIPEEVWSAVTPMLATTGGNLILLSTPFGKGGYFFRCFSDPTFTSFHVSSEDCERIPKEFLEAEKKRMSLLEYSQEYLGEFVDELRQFFSREVIESCMKLKYDSHIDAYQNYLGVDVARMGKDDTVLFTLQLKNNQLYELDKTITKKTRTTDTVRRIIDYDTKYRYKKIFIDDGGLGVAVFDPCLENAQTKRKVVAINNSSRSLDNDREKGKRKKLLKEDLYNNLLSLMEQGRIHLEYDEDTILSLMSVQCEYTHSGMKLFGNYTHIAEALIRAAWCVKTKSLKPFIHY